MKLHASVAESAMASLWIPQKLWSSGRAPSNAAVNLQPCGRQMEVRELSGPLGEQASIQVAGLTRCIWQVLQCA